MNKELVDFILGTDCRNISDTVIIAPCWSPESVGISGSLISNYCCEIWDCYMSGYKFTYIVTGVGAARCLDIMSALGENGCKKALFIGSAGTFASGISIGEIAIPEKVICAEGATRFLYSDYKEDCLGRAYSVNQDIVKSIVHEAKSYRICLHYGIGISLESIYHQYKFINSFVSDNITFVDMESSAFLSASEKYGIKSAIVYCISDNVVDSEPLYHVAQHKLLFRKNQRREYFPSLIMGYLKA